MTERNAMATPLRLKPTERDRSHLSATLSRAGNCHATPATGFCRILVGRMHIVDGKVNVCSPGRNFVTLKLTTSDGIYGLGDATLNGRELAVASYLRDHVAPLLIGRDPHRIEDTWQYLY